MQRHPGKQQGYRWLGLLATLAAVTVAAPSAQADVPAELIVVVGVAGADPYAAVFEGWSQQWCSLAAQAGAPITVIGPDADQGLPQAERLEQAIQQAATESAVPLWIVYLGHGTFDGRIARMNLAGPDVSASDLAKWLEGYPRPLAFLNCSAASAPFLPALSGPDRVVVTATRSGHEVQFARLGGFLAEALASSESDLDKDGQTSLLEAYLWASRRVENHYREQGLLATEHALLDDNGDGLGTPADWFDGVVVLKETQQQRTPDGNLAHQWHLHPTRQEDRLTPEQREQRQALEQQLTDLRRQRDEYSEEEYLQRLEEVLVPLARIYQSGGEASAAAESP